MQLGIRLHDTKKGPFEERVAIAHEQGFSCAHLALEKVISEYPVADSALTPGYTCYLKNLFAAHQLDMAVLGCYLNLATPNQAALAKKRTPLSGAYPDGIAARRGCGRHGNRSGE